LRNRRSHNLDSWQFQNPILRRKAFPDNQLLLNIRNGEELLEGFPLDWCSLAQCVATVRLGVRKRMAFLKLKAEGIGASATIKN
jgi:hypothetical protein